MRAWISRFILTQSIWKGSGSGCIGASMGGKDGNESRTPRQVDDVETTDPVEPHKVATVPRNDGIGPRRRRGCDMQGVIARSTAHEARVDIVCRELPDVLGHEDFDD